MKQVSTGVGLCVLGLCIVGYPMAERLASRAEAGVPGAAVAVAAAVTAQDPPAPTIVWYGTASLFPDNGLMGVVRAWSNGRVELKLVNPQTSGNQYCTPLPGNVPCAGPWFVISSPNEGYAAAADLNFDLAVDGVDLGMLLAKWGPAPRTDTPPSDCPLALINP